MKNQKFILIIGNIVTKRIEKDGMNRRIVAIDDVLSQYNKIYVENVYNPKQGIIRYWGRCLTNCIHRITKNPARFYGKNVNSYKLVSEKNLDKLFSQATCIYIHSLYSAMKIPLEYLEKYSHKIIVDAHGCVVEEMEFGECDKDKINKAKQYEETLFPKLKALVCVSQKMIEFYKQKYNMENVQLIKLPIFTLHKQKQYTPKNRKIVYSGGTNKWQNVDEMIEVIKKLPEDFEIKVISPDTNYFNERLGNLKNVNIMAVEPEKVQQEYEDCEYGFILRDNIIVNHVACPTKLIEYIAANLLPVVSCPAIGDFEDMGYKYITVDNLIGMKLPTQAEMQFMLQINMEILTQLASDTKLAANSLNKLISELFEQ